MGKPSRIVSRSPRWKPRAYSKRRTRVVRAPRKPRPLLDAAIAGATVLIAVGFAFLFAFVLFSRLQLPLFVGFPATTVLLGTGVLFSGRRVIHRRAMTIGLLAVSVVGAVVLYESRDDFAPGPHQPSAPAGREETRHRR
ncbi:hypothetical protein [Brevundimonas sp.]|uniref:hypothetical protein n=1 Tax=Brevundimonas sp. TaxID=1871086 RepID=UPI0035B404BC